MKSTSIHSLNADVGLNPFQKIAYLFLNILNNLFPYANVDKRIVFKNFADLEWQKHWDETYPSSSPGRKASDLFWRSLPWHEIEQNVGPLHVFDTGCGSGNYALRLGAMLVSYVGVDAKRRPTWAELEAKYPNFRFVESRSTNILPLIPPETNVFITQSAIEHFDSDLGFFEQIKEFIDKAKHPVVQIHLFPAAATLPLYLFHGFRQYTPRTISKITRLFPHADIALYGLGGSASKKLHFKYFTWPVLITRKYVRPAFAVEEYEPQLRAALEHDFVRPSRSPLFWGLVINDRPTAS